MASKISARTCIPSVARAVLDAPPVRIEMRKGSSWRRLGILGLLLMLTPGLAGCFAYTTRQRRMVAASGSGEFSEIKKTRKATPSTREVVQKNLGYLDTGLSSSTFFWGRWTRGKELHFVAIGAPGAGGGSIGGSSPSGTVVENLLIEFDNDGHATRWNVVDDDDLLKKMVPILRRNTTSGSPSLPVPSPCRFQWDQLTRVKSDPPPRRLRIQHHDLIYLQFFTESDKRKPVCSVDASAGVTFGIVEHLISMGRDAVLK